MGVNRRGFFKIAGITALGLAGAKPAVNALSGKSLPDPAEEREDLAGKRWAVAIDLKKCKSDEGCRDCVNVCHTRHNVPDFGNKKDEIKWIWTEEFPHAFTEQEHELVADDLKEKPVPVFCNHCDNPPCTRVCPTKATFKRADGVVVMDWHRCIGCRYCMAACPYGSRSFNWRDPRPFIKDMNPEYPTRSHGVVEKCTLCDGMPNDAGKIDGLPHPACVKACPENAMIFGDLEDPESDIRAILKDRFSIRRKPGLGTQPEIYYLV